MITLLTFALALAALPSGDAAGASPADRAIAAAERGQDHGRPDDHVALATAFLQKARESGDPAWYRRAAAALDRAVAQDPDHYEALRARAWVLLGQHEFRAALAVAEQASAREPDDWWNYGPLADAAVELGDYARARAAVERMAALRPGLPSYTRVAFLRSLHGDRAGALAALELALSAGTRRDPEALAWTLVHLGHEHFAGGALTEAAAAYAEALALFPDYHLALAGLARVRAAEGRLREAVDLYRRATERVPSPEVVAALGDVHAAAGEPEEAERHYALVEHMARVAAAAGAPEGRQLARFYADHDRRLDEALRLARAEAAARADIHTHDTLAWALYKNGRLAAAKRASQRALRLDSADAMLHYHAGMIAAALGRPRPAARHLARALALNPHFDLRQAPIARSALEKLGDRRLAARGDAR
jgi:tetratricopeptide (TPR) repeat protein